MSRCSFRAAAFRSAAVISGVISERRDNVINLRELNYGALIFHVTCNENTLKDSPLITAPTLPPSAARALRWFWGPGGLSHRQLQQFAEHAVAFALDEGVGAAGLGYSYPGQSGFLRKVRRKGQRVRRGGRKI